MAVLIALGLGDWARWPAGDGLDVQLISVAGWAFIADNLIRDRDDTPIPAARRMPEVASNQWLAMAVLS